MRSPYTLWWVCLGFLVFALLIGGCYTINIMDEPPHPEDEIVEKSK